jgi:hypothetical protein
MPGLQIWASSGWPHRQILVILYFGGCSDIGFFPLDIFTDVT